MDKNFSKDKVAVITGGAKKIGRSTAKKLANQGFNVLIHTGGKSIDEAKKTVELVKGYSVKSDVVDGDLGVQQDGHPLCHPCGRGPGTERRLNTVQ